MPSGRESGTVAGSEPLGPPVAMIVLALDCSAGACSAAVASGDRLCASHWRAMGRGHAEALVPMVERAAADAAVRFPEIGEIRVTRGPGSFTGIRIALSAAQGLALATGAAIVAVDSFEALRPAVPPDRRVLGVMDAGRGNFHVRDLQGTSPPFTASAERLLALAPFDAVGDGAARIAGLAPGSVRACAPGLPDAARLLLRPLTGGPPVPLYLTRPHLGPAP